MSNVFLILMLFCAGDKAMSPRTCTVSKLEPSNGETLDESRALAAEHSLAILEGARKAGVNLSLKAVKFYTLDDLTAK